MSVEGNTTMLYYSIDHPDPDNNFTVTVVPINEVGLGESASTTCEHNYRMARNVAWRGLKFGRLAVEKTNSQIKICQLLVSYYRCGHIHVVVEMLYFRFLQR